MKHPTMKIGKFRISYIRKSDNNFYYFVHCNSLPGLWLCVAKFPERFKHCTLIPFLNGLTDGDSAVYRSKQFERFEDRCDRYDVFMKKQP